VLGDGAKVTGLTYKDRNHDSVHQVDLEGVFVQIGLVPNTEWLKDSGVALTQRGEIEVDHRGETSLPGVFAAGDATTTPYKQIIIAMGEGSKAALSAFDYMIRLEPAAGGGLRPCVWLSFESRLVNLSGSTRRLSPLTVKSSRQGEGATSARSTFRLTFEYLVNLC
jgi:hypothetical protein